MSKFLTLILIGMLFGILGFVGATLTGYSNLSIPAAVGAASGVTVVLLMKKAKQTN